MHRLWLLLLLLLLLGGLLAHSLKSLAQGSRTGVSSGSGAPGVGRRCRRHHRRRRHRRRGRDRRHDADSTSSGTWACRAGNNAAGNGASAGDRSVGAQIRVGHPLDRSLSHFFKRVDLTLSIYGFYSYISSYVVVSFDLVFFTLLSLFL